MDLNFLRDKYKVSEFSDKTVSQMMKLISSLEKNFTEIEDSWELNLDLICMNLEILNNAYKDIQEQGKLQKDARDRLQKNPSIGLFFNAQAQVQNLLNKMGMTVLAKCRVKQYLKDEDSSKDEFESNFEN